MEKIFSSGNQVFLHYLIDVNFGEKQQLIAVMGYMLIDSGKIQISRQLQYMPDET